MEHGLLLYWKIFTFNFKEFKKIRPSRSSTQLMALYFSEFFPVPCLVSLDHNFSYFPTANENFTKYP
jgi:hypothetical protein